jgi:hypothetical protein
MSKGDAKAKPISKASGVGLNFFMKTPVTKEKKRKEKKN